MAKYLLHNSYSFVCLVSETTSRRQHDHAPTRSYHSPEHRARPHRLSRSTIYRKIAEGTFPPRIKISVNGAGWRESDINRWVANPAGWRPYNEFDFLNDH